MINVCLPFGDQHGWGIAGRNISNELAKLSPIRIFVQQTPPELRKYVPADWNPAAPIAVREPLLQAVTGYTFRPWNERLRSRVYNVGYAFIEDIKAARQHVADSYRYYDHIVAGSTWCASKLREIGVGSVSVAIQGVDTELFRPRGGENSETNRFTIVSPGKIEYRKGHDLVIAVFKRFLAKHPDAHLLCCWANHWPQFIDSLAHSQQITYPQTAGDWKAKAHATLALNGVPEDRYTLVDAMPHHDLAEIYAQGDVALCLSRCEAGTNLPLMECMACGVPVIGSAGTGHMDVLAPKHSYVVTQGVYGANEWFEANTDCAYRMLEHVYENRDSAREIGEAGRRFIGDFSWEKTAKAIYGACAPQLQPISAREPQLLAI